MTYADRTGTEIAVIGMAGRFPGARNIGEFWNNLRDGVESITFFSDEEVLAAGISEALVANPNYVRARGILGNVDRFDAAFFGYSPKEAASMDPQHRLFLETAWQALEDAGYDAKRYPGSIGVYASVGFNSYLVLNMEVAPDFIHAEHGPQAMLGNDKDFLASRVSYKLNLTGPSMVIQTACSSSLMAIHQAVQSLLSGEADMQLAGGVTVRVPEHSGNLYQEGMINSPDGHCRPFDEEAAGTVAGNGVGVVVLKRLEDALADGDHIYAVIKASAANNDGDDKVGYSAPSSTGQARVIAAAQALAEMPARTIGLIEAHGSGTRMGDPIEIEALRQAFGQQTRDRQFCAVGSVKSNIGHLDAAAGVAGFIKTVLALHHRQIPPSVNFRQPNPLCQFDTSPFYVPTRVQDWPAQDHSRRAGVSSFGMGGTNVHLVLEEAPPPQASGASRPWQLACLSAKTATALDRIKDRMRADLQGHQDRPLADIAYTLALGRQRFTHNFFCLARDTPEAHQKLSMGHNDQCFGAVWDGIERPVVFMFSGQGAQFVNMGRALYEQEPAFRAEVDACARHLAPLLGLDLVKLLYPRPGEEAAAAARLDQTRFTQPALFTVEYALARLLLDWGVRPEALIGHSIGEYVAACLAGVFNREDALTLVAHRGRLMQSLPQGSMLFVLQCAQQVQPHLNEQIVLATVNSPLTSVLAGPTEAIAELQARLEADGVKTQLLRTSHAFHSPMMEPILAEFQGLFAGIGINAPALPVMSNLTGQWLTGDQARDPGYWAAHLRHTVQFAQGIERIAKGPQRLFVEVGPGSSLERFAQQTLGSRAGHGVLSVLPRKDGEDAQFALLRALGRLWQQGVAVDWQAFYAGQRRHRLPLGAYPFDGGSYWVNINVRDRQSQQERREEVFWSPTWTRQTLTQGQPVVPVQTLVLHPTLDQAIGLSPLVARNGTRWVDGDHQFARLGERRFRLERGNADHYRQLFTEAGLDPDQPLDIVFCYPPRAGRAGRKPGRLRRIARRLGGRFSRPGPLRQAAERLDGFLAFARALADQAGRQRGPLRLTVVTGNAFAVAGDETPDWERQFLVKALEALCQLMPALEWQFVDAGSGRSALLTEDLQRFEPGRVLAYRGGQRWSRRLVAQAIPGEGRMPAADHLLVLAPVDDWLMHLLKSWQELQGGRLVFPRPEAVPPQDQWPDHPEYRRLLELRQQGVELEAVHCPLQEPGRVARLVRQLAARGPVAALNILPSQPHREADVLLHLDASALTGLTLAARSQLAMLDGLPLSYVAWCGFQPALLGYPDHAVNLVIDSVIQAGAGPGHRFAYLDPDLFGQDFTKDWLHRVDFGQRVGQVAKALSQPGSDYVWLSAQSPDRLAWKPTEAASGQTPGRAVQADEGPRYERPELSTPYAPPITERHKIICAIWQSMFQIDRVGIHDNFFDLGGDSIMALKLLSALEVEFQVGLPLSEVINAPTVAEQANSIMEYARVGLDQREPSPLVTLQAKGSRPPFFCVHPAGGIIHCYIELSRLLGKDQPFYALQHPGIDGKVGPYGSYPAMAELYVKALRQIQPEGPYFLGGWSFGGTVAYEMACQLRAQGQEVALLALLDSPGPSALYKVKQRPEFEFAGMLAFLSQALSTMFGGQIHIPLEEMRQVAPEKQLDFILDRLVSTSGDEEMGNAREALERIVDIFEVCDKGERDYQPTPYDGDIHIYRVQELADYEFTGYKDHPELTSATFGWDQLCRGQVQVRFVPGTHISMVFQPNVQTVADKLAADLTACADRVAGATALRRSA